MSKKKLNIKWYSLAEILKRNAQYYIIFGERSNGKSYAVDTYVIDKFFESGGKSQFAFVKRYVEDLKGSLMDKVFSPLEDYILEKYNHKIKFYRGSWYLYPSELEGKMSECKVFGHALSISGANRTKAVGFPDVDTVLFEEFMSMNCDYLIDELNMFLNLMSTIIRYRTNVKVFMLANAISKSSPYSTALKVKFHRMKQGEIIEKSYKNKQGLTTYFAIERSENVNVYNNEQNKGKVSYNVFGDSGVGEMITTGEFEVHSYPRTVNNVTFGELKQGNEKVITKKERLPIVVKFEDYFYRIYLSNQGLKDIIGFREIEENTINLKNTSYVINSSVAVNGVPNIKNLAYYDDKEINDILNLIVACLRQKDFVTLTDDDGENVFNAFRQSGINLIQN